MRVFVQRLGLAALGCVLHAAMVTSAAAEPNVKPAQPRLPAVVPSTATAVYLDRSAAWALTSAGNQHSGRLAREIARQALLIAAREELGLTTRDFWLDDARPKSDGIPQIEIDASPGSPNLLEILSGPFGQQELIWQRELPLSAWVFDYRDWVRQLETMSRTQFVAALEQAGYARRPRPKLVTADAEDVEPWLSSLSFTSQFYAVRLLHAQIAAQGETPKRLAGLVRGYANLGVLCEYFWHPMHEVFKARALLYGERLVSRDDWSARSLAQRGYAWALLGWHGAALEDFALARSAAAQKSKPAVLPDWFELVAAFCRFEPDLSAKNPRHAELAALLRQVSAEQVGVAGLSPQVAAREMQNAFECYRICDGFALHYGHESAEEAFKLPPNGEDALQRTLYLRLSEMPGLPDAVQKLIAAKAPKGKVSAEAEPALRGEVITALLASDPWDKQPAAQAGSADEFSWAMLGRLLQEVSFFQAWRQLRPDLGHHEEVRLARLLPGVPSHRYRGFLQMAQKDPSAHRRGYRLLLEARDLEMLEATGAPILQYASGFKASAEGLSQLLQGRGNYLPREIVALMPNPFTDRCGTSKVLLQISPYSPLARSTLAACAWHEMRPHGADWEKTSAAYPHVLTAIGNQWANEGQLADAERILNAAQRQQPTVGGVRALADLYRRQGKPAERLEMLKKLLAMPGLDNPGAVGVEIATFYMQEGKWELAKKYATQAATHGTTAGRMLAAEVNEAMQDWATAEEHFKDAAEAYNEHPFNPDWLEWLAFCKRTGQGDEAAALRLGALKLSRHEAWQKIVPPPDKQPLLEFTYHHLLNDLEKARGFCDTGFNLSGDPSFGLHAALITGRLGDAKSRGERLAKLKAQQEAWAKAHPERPLKALHALIEQIASDYDQPKSGFTRGQVDKLAAGVSEAEQIDLYYFAGEYAAQRDLGKLSFELFEECMIRLPIRATNRTLAGKALWDRAGLPKAYAARLRSRAANPPKPN